MKAVFIGRFQPFHRGHRKVVEKYSEQSDDFCIAIGSAGEQETEDNPLSFEERRSIIQACYPDLEIVGIDDTERTDEGDGEWLEEVRNRTNADTVISGNKIVQRIVEASEMDLERPELHDPEIYSGTAIRRRIKSGEEWRYLVPKCAEETIADLLDRIKDSGINYDFEPGWERKNAFHDTYEK